MRVIAVVAALVCGVASVSAADIELRAVRDGRDVVVADRAKLAAKLIALVESCSVNSTAYAVSGNSWAQIAASDSFVQVVFSKPRRVRVMSENNHVREERAIQAILLPLPEGSWPPHIFVRSGNETLSFTKDDPLVLREVVLQQELGLLTVTPYKSLVSVPRKQ